MKKLNNKGITTVEVLVCFVLITIMTVSMYATISSYNKKRILEAYKEEVISYKNTITKMIQDDFIKIGIMEVKHTRTVENTPNKRIVYRVNCTLKDGTKRLLKVTRQVTKSGYHPDGFASVDDYYMIEYGEDESNLIEYPIPDLGSFVNKDTNKKVLELSINNIYINIAANNVLTIYIGFYHPELFTKYAISIVCPINYISVSSENIDSSGASYLSLRSSTTATGSMKVQEGGVGKTYSNANIGVLTLVESVREGEVGLAEDTGIVCSYSKQDGSSLPAGSLTINETTSDGKVRKLEISSNIPENATYGAYISCNARIKDNNDVVKEEVYTGYIGNGWEKGEKHSDVCSSSGEYNLWYFYAKGKRVEDGADHDLYWYDSWIPEGKIATYHFFSGTEGWTCKNGQTSKGSVASGWCRIAAGKWVYYHDGCSSETEIHSAKIKGKTVQIRSNYSASDLIDYTFDANGICTAGPSF